MRNKRKRLNLGSPFTQLVGNREQQAAATAGPGHILLDVEYPPEGIELHFEDDGIARTPATSSQPKPSLGESIKRLCKECGWSPYRLSKETGFDKNLIAGHINKRKTCRIGTLKKYAEVFSKGCNRQVTISELDPRRT